MQTNARRNRQAAARPDRKQAILLAAEKLFAQRGYHAVSIRQIAKEADVPLALVSYYFGQKHELFHAIFASWSGTIAERLEALAEIGRAPTGEPRLRRIVQAFVEPVLRLRASPEGEYYALLITQGLGTGQREADSVLRDFFDPMAMAFIDALHDALREQAPDVSRGTAAWCYQFALGALLHHISDTRVERLSQGANLPQDPRAASLLIDFIVHGIHGAVLPPPVSRPTTRKSP
ncbi:TetR/AcrR family transcriptional regulator [Verticiella sediminum]|uniref:TetR/AcrR family transcriptional regulator n=1 Tax=Verticiella sediminum TaxID=1247510 RepID=A0A556ACH6_9BURK|nr:TetR/AcrR family transcriptional regulator [Verticiella sediminum]TSH90596.1 TetR/AcrR family transcriptional regulator [Verticiella sediminum]